MLSNVRGLGSKPSKTEAPGSKQLGPGVDNVKRKKPCAARRDNGGRHSALHPLEADAKLYADPSKGPTSHSGRLAPCLISNNSVASHEVLLSDISEYEGEDPDSWCPGGGRSPPSETPSEAFASGQMSQRQPSPSLPQPLASQPVPASRPASSPAAALASLAVASARRRAAAAPGPAPAVTAFRRRSTTAAATASAAAAAAALQELRRSNLGDKTGARPAPTTRGRRGSAGALAMATAAAAVAVLLLAAAAATSLRAVRVAGSAAVTAPSSSPSSASWLSYAGVGVGGVGGGGGRSGGSPSARSYATAAAAAGVSRRHGVFSSLGSLLRFSLPGRWTTARRGDGAAGVGGSVVGGMGGGSARNPLPVLAAVADGAGGLGESASGLGGQHHEPDYGWRESATARVITITSGAPSPYGTSWDDLASHSAQRLEWTDPGFQMLVFPQEQLAWNADVQLAFIQALSGGAHMLVGLDVTDDTVGAFLREPHVARLLPPAVLFVGGSEPLAKELTRLQGGLRPQDGGSWRTALARRLPWTPDGAGLAVWDTLQLLLGRRDSDNFLFVFLVLINQYVTPVRQVADSTKGFDLQSLACMMWHCGPKVLGCVRDPTCKAALDCLNDCSFNDQVCQYRCIVSHESPLLSDFSLCVLQLHNCRNLHTQPPALPDPGPMPAFRGAPLTHETAEQLLTGWLQLPGSAAGGGGSLQGEQPGRPISWLVAAGKNPAYDHFPCQHQLFYPGKGRGQFWYEPVFKAITLDGREVWRRRLYRVRRGKVPGTFHLSVLDNGVTSNEFWRILDCDDRLEFCLFYYSGAASAAGLSYSGAVLATPDGRVPGPQHAARLEAALRRAGIRTWELSYVDNSNCEGAPLEITGPVGLPAAAAAGAAAA